MAKIAFIGLGVMGYPMAAHLKKTFGHDVTVYNRTAEKAERWAAQFDGRSAPTAREAAGGQEFVITCVGNDDDLRAVTLGPDGAFAAMPQGSIFIDHTTASAGIARELSAAAAERGFAALDAPVSGGQSGAEKGILTVMCGGDAEVFERAQPVMGAYAQAATLMGPAGAGQLAKMVNQIMVAGVLQSVSEGLAFAKKAGLDTDRLVATLSRGAAQSWQLEHRHATMVLGEFDFGFAVDLMRKDLGHCLAEARRNGAALPVTALIDQFYADVQALGGSRWDASSLIARLD